MSQITPEAENLSKVYFPSHDNLRITGDLYPVEKPKGFILLCHRSHSNRGEYGETAPKFNALGFSCLAIDQRSGMKVFGKVNETSALAREKGLATGYLDARKDIEAAVDYAFNVNDKQPIIILGSSYSASLALLIAKDTKKIKRIVAFSPGEFLKGTAVANEIRSISRPIFVTSAKKEIADVQQLLRHVDQSLVTHFKPETEGFHGSKILWRSVKGFEACWQELEQFLEQVAVVKLQY